MDIYEKLKAWLAQQGAIFQIDRCDHPMGSLGWFPQGVQELKTREDVVGNRYRTLRYSFLLRLVAPPGEATAQLLLQLQAQAPEAGFCATGGSMKKAGSQGLAIYEIRLTAEREEKL